MSARCRPAAFGRAPALHAPRARRSRSGAGFCDLERDEAGVARVELAGDDGRQTTLWLGPAYR
jgi:hypothetical protein